jgi:hypothetical protein
MKSKLCYTLLYDDIYSIAAGDNRGIHGEVLLLLLLSTFLSGSGDFVEWLRRHSSNGWWAGRHGQCTSPIPDAPLFRFATFEDSA